MSRFRISWALPFVAVAKVVAAPALGEDVREVSKLARDVFAVRRFGEVARVEVVTAVAPLAGFDEKQMREVGEKGLAQIERGAAGGMHDTRATAHDGAFGRAPA